MAGLVPAIHENAADFERRGCPAQGRAWRVGSFARWKGALQRI